MQENENEISNETNENEQKDNIPEDGQKLYSQEELNGLLKAERAKISKELAEAKKLAELPESERGDYKRSLLDKELSDREKAVAKRELMADAAERLTEAGYPRQLAKCLDYSGKEEYEKSLKDITAVFGGAVISEVNKRLSGRVPHSAAGNKADAFLDGLGM